MFCPALPNFYLILLYAFYLNSFYALRFQLKTLSSLILDVTKCLSCDCRWISKRCTPFINGNLLPSECYLEQVRCRNGVHLMHKHTCLPRNIALIRYHGQTHHIEESYSLNIEFFVLRLSDQIKTILNEVLSVSQMLCQEKKKSIRF